MKFLKQTIDQIEELVVDPGCKISAKFNSFAIPSGSLGRLEELATIYASIKNDVNCKIRHKKIFTIAGDHGVAEEGGVHKKFLQDVKHSAYIFSHSSILLFFFRERCCYTYFAFHTLKCVQCSACTCFRVRILSFLFVAMVSIYKQHAGVTIWVPTFVIVLITREAPLIFLVRKWWCSLRSL